MWYLLIKKQNSVEIIFNSKISHYVLNIRFIFLCLWLEKKTYDVYLFQFTVLFLIVGKNLSFESATNKIIFISILYIKDLKMHTGFKGNFN